MEKDELLETYRYILTENQKIANLKNEITQSEKNYLNKLEEVKKAKDDMSGWTAIIELTPMVLGVICFFKIFVSILDGEGMSAIFFAGCTIFLFAVGILLGVILFAKNDRDKCEIKAAKIHNEEALPLYTKYEKKVEELNEILKTTRIGTLENSIPQDYRTEDALTFFVKALETGRADSEKELYNLYEEELHRKRLENIELEKLQKLDASLTHCPKCGGTRCQMITESKSSTKPFDLGDACCGAILLGPVGILCGLCGMESTAETKTYWVCQDCGNKFSD